MNEMSSSAIEPIHLQIEYRTSDFTQACRVYQELTLMH
jgi:hypothetical protein